MNASAMVLERFDAARFLKVSPDRTLHSTRRGKSAISREAVAPGSKGAAGPSGSDAIRVVNFAVAAFSGKFASEAASAQGSTSIRESADRTLNSIPLRSTPMVANKNALKSDPGRELTTVVGIADFLGRKLEHGAISRGKFIRPPRTVAVSTFHVLDGNRLRDSIHALWPKIDSRIWRLRRGFREPHPFGILRRHGPSAKVGRVPQSPRNPF
jgi:hypothetical protein